MNKSFIVIETKRGRASPWKVWSATSEHDYMQRVAASNPRSGESFDDFEAVVRSDMERHSMTVEFMTKADFDSFDAEDLDPKILDEA